VWRFEKASNQTRPRAAVAAVAVAVAVTKNFIQDKR
jgi:hypothetical protein